MKMKNIFITFVLFVSCNETLIENEIARRINWSGDNIQLDSGKITFIKHSGTKYFLNFNENSNVQFSMKSDIANKSASFFSNGAILLANSAEGDVRNGRVVKLNEYNQIVQDYWYHKSNNEYCEFIYNADGSFINTFNDNYININCIDTPTVILTYDKLLQSYELEIHSTSYPLMYIDKRLNFWESKNYKGEAFQNMDYYLIPENSFEDDSLNITFYFKNDKDKILKTISYSAPLPK